MSEQIYKNIKDIEATVPENDDILLIARKENGKIVWKKTTIGNYTQNFAGKTANPISLIGRTTKATEYSSVEDDRLYTGAFGETFIIDIQGEVEFARSPESDEAVIKVDDVVVGDEFTGIVNKNIKVFLSKPSSCFVFKKFNELNRFITSKQAKKLEFYSNSLKGRESGEVVNLDVSPIEHELKVKVANKNFFNIDNVVEQPCSSNLGGIIKVENGTALEVTTPINLEGVRNNMKLKDYAPELEVGTTYTLYADTTGDRKFIFLSKAPSGTGSWKFGTSRTITQEDLDSSVYWYTFANDRYMTTAVISNIQIVEEETNIEDITTVKVTKSGGNLFDIKGREVVDFGRVNNALQSKVERNFTGKGIILGYRKNNLYSPTKIVEASFQKDKIGFVFKTTSPYYGIGFDFKVLPNTIYTLHYAGIDSDVNTTIVVTQYGADGIPITNPNFDITFENTADGKAKQFTTGEDTAWVVIVFCDNRGNEETPYLSRFCNLCLSVEKYIEYEPYVEPTEYMVEADGTVKGVTSLYPTTMLTTDTKNAIIDVQYNRDINKAFTSLEEKITAKIAAMI